MKLMPLAQAEALHARLIAKYNAPGLSDHAISRLARMCYRANAHKRVHALRAAKVAR